MKRKPNNCYIYEEELWCAPKKIQKRSVKRSSFVDFHGSYIQNRLFSLSMSYASAVSKSPSSYSVHHSVEFKADYKFSVFVSNSDLSYVDLGIASYPHSELLRVVKNHDIQIDTHLLSPFVNPPIHLNDNESIASIHQKK